MKKIVMTFTRLFIILSIVIMVVACGSKTDQRRQQEIEDSIKLDQDRRILLERANQMLDQSTSDQDKTAEDVDGSED